MSKTLALDSLEIRNYRGLRELRIDRLGRVNLIVGRNNVGKTSVLEALRLYARPGTLILLMEILGARDEFDPSSSRVITGGELGALPVESLFTRDLFDRSEPPTIQIGPIAPDTARLSISLGLYDESAVALRPGSAESVSELVGDSMPRRLLVFKMSDRRWALSVDNSRTLRRIRFSTGVVERGATSRYVGPDGIEPARLVRLWEEIALTPLEDDVIAALNLIHPGVVRLSFRHLASISRASVPFVKVRDQDTPVPLRTMGDGMNRIFGIVAALVSAAGGFLLVDEIENGIHYSALEGFWKLIFNVSSRLNVQVFATSHSWDCVESFQKAASQSLEEGVLVRLAKKGGRLLVGEFDERDLEIAVDGKIEVR